MRGRLTRLLVLVAALAVAACAPPEPVRQEAYVFGTRVEIQVAGLPEAQAHAAMAEALREFDRLHREYHAWQPSQLSALNEALAAGKKHEVSAELAGFIRRAQEVAAAGEHLFDPGIGKLIALWGFQSDEIGAKVPAEKEIKALLRRKPSIAALRVEGNQVSNRRRAVALDFGGYLKGVALDRAAAILRERGVANALINIGGNILALGDKNGTPWRVGIRHPRPERVGNVPLASLELRDGEAIGTSGDYQRFFEVDGRRYCHLIDPRSGRPADGTQSLTILIPPGPEAGMRSDAYSKPIFIAGERWLDMAKKLEVDAVLKVSAGGTAEVTQKMKARLTIEAPDLILKVRN